jgi:hypothetical protein
MKYYLCSIVFSLLTISSFRSECQSVSTTSISIWTPRKATPAYIEPGGVLTAEVIAPKTLTAKKWQVALISDLGKEWDCKFISAAYSTNGLDLGAKSGWKIRFIVPTSVVPELCAIKITCPDYGNETRSDAVSVVPPGTLKKSFYGVLFTDEHIFRKAAIKEDGANSMDNILLSAQVLNIANPRFVACPGDYSTAQSRREEDWIENNYLTVKSAFKVPTLQSTGNHEYDHWQNVPKTIPLDFTYEDYEKYFGQRSYVTTMGPVSILMHEIYTNQPPVTPDTALLTRVVAKWATVLSDTSIKYRLIVQHCFDPVMGAFIPENRGQGINGCNLMLGGHVHQTLIKSVPDNVRNYFRLYGTAAQQYGRSEWFNFNNDGSNNWSCLQANSGYCDSLNTTPLYSNALTKTLNLTVTYTHENDGTYTGTTNSCTITNKIKFNFYDGRIRFLMPKGKYVVTGGTMLGEYDYTVGNTTKTAVICKVNIPARTNVDGSAWISVISGK